MLPQYSLGLFHFPSETWSYVGQAAIEIDDVAKAGLNILSPLPPLPDAWIINACHSVCLVGAL